MYLEGFYHSLLSRVGWTGELNGSSLFIFGHFASSIALLFLIRTLVWDRISCMVTTLPFVISNTYLSGSKRTR